ncbi:hypothetical protein [Alterisphingorhabdus coralli]|uniref:Uncharacterized protein n=1 Tax=Alterisphingorhabdus coralli TaxID=3071408 RepID=A0AA97F5R3_9SPHN|nr:hypothetical protein [Parasphingorhabdus sp. SCSIO 66989]WOE74458.1 hypothetical protein RB602_11445 [Parasphingorhabdus sp. SCSIO 66989]
MDEAHARRRFMIISLVRFSGVIIVMVALLAINGVIVGLPDIFSYGLLAIGLVEFFFVPIVLARMWRTPPEDVPEP